MADLFLHLPFARRLRFAEGLHPLAGEAIGRRPSLVVLGAALAGLPENERRGMSWLRRLFSRGGEAARWQKLLAPTPGSPHIEVITQLLSPDDAALGPLARLALGIGVLSHEVLEEKIGSTTASLQDSQRAAVERAQARLWLQSAIPGRLEGEWKPVLELADPEANKRALQHVDRALKRVHGSGPGEAALGRWLKGLALEVSPLAEGRGPSGALPPSLSVADHDARGPHFDSVGFVEKTQSAVQWIVGVANRLGEAYTKGNPDRAAVADAIAKLAESKNGEAAGAKDRWKSWLQNSKEAALTRGRNPKPAFIEGEAVAEHHRPLGGATAVMRLSDLPPESEAGASGAPPLPPPSEASGAVPAMRGPAGPPNAPPMPPGVTQEVSLAQIEAEAAAQAQGFQAPAHTQEVSVAQIESLVPVAATPDGTQEVQTHQVVDQSKVTQPISADDVAKANAEDERAAAASATANATASAAEKAAVDAAKVAADAAAAAKVAADAAAAAKAAADAAAAAAAAAGAATSAPVAPVTGEVQAPGTAPPDGAPTSAHPSNGANGVTHTDSSTSTTPAATAPTTNDPPRE